MSAGLIPEEIINQIRERVDIADVVANYVALSRTGQNLKGLCPFHSEKSPSFTSQSIPSNLPLLWMWNGRKCVFFS